MTLCDGCEKPVDLGGEWFFSGVGYWHLACRRAVDEQIRQSHKKVRAWRLSVNSTACAASTAGIRRGRADPWPAQSAAVPTTTRLTCASPSSPGGS